MVEQFNSCSASKETLADSLGKLRAVSTGDNKRFNIISTQINVELLLAVITEYSSTSDSGIVGDACNLLTKIFGNLSASNVLQKYGTYVISSLSLNCVEFQNLCLQQIARLAEEDEHFSEFLTNPDLIIVTIKYLGEDDLGVAGIARKILNLLFCHNENLEWLFSNHFIELFKEISQRNSIVQFRIFEVFVDFVLKYPEHVETCRSAGIFDGLISTLMNSGDILSQLNALEQLSKVAMSGLQGLRYVEEKSIMTWVEKTIISNDPVVGLLLPGAVKFFGVVAQADPLRVIPKYENTTNSLFENIVSEDPSIRCLCAETIAFIGAKPEGLKILNSNPDRLKRCVRVMAKMIMNPGEDDYIRSRTAASLSSMFDHCYQDVEVSMICEKLFRQIDQHPISYLFKLAQQPFSELRYCSLKLLAAVSRYSWAEQDFVLCAGFLEYLLDRKTETEKQGHELKYEIIKNLSLSQTSKDNLGIDYYEKLIKYTKQGPFYSESHVEVSYEQGD